MSEADLTVLRFFLLASTGSYFLYVITAKIVEPLYCRIFGRPLFLYCSIVLKKLPAQEQVILVSEVEFYKTLSHNHQRIFEHRVASFVLRYRIYGKGGLEITPQITVSIAASYVKLTFGMRRYLIDVFDRIILYPDTYESTISKTLHNGEFNPKLRTIVFSWRHIQSGLLVENDNINLAIHEFTHALHCHATVSGDVSAQIFLRNYLRIMTQVKHAPNLKLLIDSDYFRIYAFTNEFEFLAVIVEHFIETPSVFQNEFPQLYDLVKKMLNFRSIVNN